MTSSLLILLILSFAPLIASFVLPLHRPNLPLTLPPSHHHRTIDFTFGVRDITPEAPPTVEINEGFTPEQRATFGMNDVTPDAAMNGFTPEELVTFEGRDAITPESVVMTMGDDGGVTRDDTLNLHPTDDVVFNGEVPHRRSPPPSFFTRGIINPITDGVTEPPMIE
ncbi:hypothetical protein PRIPAC_74095 [Pristionchus pacificus]|uniref:Uncharacterized protein n=1 Tax=Pristionchus pacificus TaxID=54126 RepID=A0A454XLS5_PRIPA|nr:hypothetical protein PRIPAC_74095 [Pristionchus pacificus]|eukprot:PDM83778.1 hypothetical protein PRIPAC_30265 [Pristionchus pacificus]